MDGGAAISADIILESGEKRDGRGEIRGVGCENGMAETSSISPSIR